VYISPDEIQSGCLLPDTLRRATRELHDAGYVVLEQVMDAGMIGRVRDAYRTLFEAHIQKPEIRARLDAGNPYVGMYLPFTPPFSEEIISANPLAVQVMEAAMGEIVCVMYHSNTTLQGNDVQPIHIDMPNLLFPGFPVATPPWLMVVNIPLIDFTLENGSTEVWPGTHLNTEVDNLLERCATMPSVRTNVRAGDLIVRDLRLWHRGMPNHTSAIRTMLAIVYNTPWFRQTEPPIQIPRASWEALSEHAQQIFSQNVIVDQAHTVAKRG
jgi:ectoine hydroxylase-related dioxygenase (phytanoyl-CoA dioxygenase family)